MREHLCKEDLHCVLTKPLRFIHQCEREKTLTHENERLSRKCMNVCARCLGLKQALWGRR